MRLDDFQALVHQRRRIDADLGSHIPRGVGKRLSRRDIGQIGARASAEGAARSRYPKLAHLFHALPEQALVYRPMLRIDGHERTCRSRRRSRATRTPLLVDTRSERHDEIAADHKRFLVGKREHLACAKRLVARTKARRTHKRIHHDVRFGNARETDYRVLPEFERSRRFRVVGKREVRGEGSRGGIASKAFVAHRCMAHAEFAHLSFEHVDTGPQCQADDFEFIGMLPHHVESLGSNRSRRSQYDDALFSRHANAPFPRCAHASARPCRA